MSCSKLSTVIEKQIERLHLRDFPCGHGSWRKTKDRPDDAQTEDTHALLQLLSCPHSPWRLEASWSPQAPALRRLAVLTPQRFNSHFIYSYFTTLRITDKGVSVIDDGLLKFTKLEELVLSVNDISEIPAENLPSSLKILELRSNLLSTLNGLTNRLPPRLQYLGLGSNYLGSNDDIRYLTGSHWPQLVCLDLGDCDFQDLRALHHALLTLTRLRTLVLEGNPFTLSPSYPGFTVDVLPQLTYLDAAWISPEERHNFRGWAKKSDLIVDQALVTVSVARLKGLPNPLRSVDITTCSYFITYDLNFESKIDAAHATESADGSSDADTVRSNGSHEKASKPDTHDRPVYTDDSAHVSRCSTSKQTWSECMDFNDTQTYIASDLRALKRFFHRGLYLTIEEEKVLPAACKHVPSAKPSRAVKEKKGQKGKDVSSSLNLHRHTDCRTQTPVKPGSTKDKSKDRKKKSVPELVQDAPIVRSLGCVHVPLQTLVTGGQKIHVICDLELLHTGSEAEVTHEKDLGKKIQEDKNKDKDSKQGGKNPTASKGKGKGKKESEMDVHTVSVQPVSVELTVELEKWHSASEARQLLLH